MRISGISNNSFNNYKKNNNVSFGRFLDENAYNVVKDKLLSPKVQPSVQGTNYYYFNLFQDVDFIDVYTSGKKVEAKFDIEKVKSYAARRGYNDVETAYAVGKATEYTTGPYYNKLTKNMKKNAECVGSAVADIVSARQRAYEKQPTYEELRAAERAEEERMRMHIFERMPW